MHRLLLAVMGALALNLGALGAVSAENKIEAGTGTGATVSAADKSFMMDAAAGGMAEVELGMLARDTGQSADVREFAQRMIEDHGKANNELRGLAQKKGANLPADLLPKHRNAKDQLAKLTGPTFDKKYLQQMIKDHEATVALFEREAMDGKDVDVIAWAKQTLPTLRAHLKMARECEARTGKSAAH